jgi:hypothetical protein
MTIDPSTGQNCNPQATCSSKWNQATAAVGQAVTSTQATVRWGLKLFSTDLACQVNAGVQVPIALTNAQSITTALAATAPGGSTPTSAAIIRGGDYLSMLTTPNPRFMVLVTDGEPTCGAAGTNTPDDSNAIGAVAAQAARGYGTFVVGIATIGNTGADATLTAMSTAGMHPRAGTPNFYLTNNTAELVTALEAIASQINSCTFALDARPPNPSNVTVEGDGNIIPANDANGWVYDPGMQGIILTGEYCARVVSGAIQSVVARFGC